MDFEGLEPEDIFDTGTQGENYDRLSKILQLVSDPSLALSLKLENMKFMCHLANSSRQVDKNLILAALDPARLQRLEKSLDTGHDIEFCGVKVSTLQMLLLLTLCRLIGKEFKTTDALEFCDQEKDKCICLFMAVLDYQESQKEDIERTCDLIHGLSIPATWCAVTKEMVEHDIQAWIAHVHETAQLMSHHHLVPRIAQIMWKRFFAKGRTSCAVAHRTVMAILNWLWNLYQFVLDTEISHLLAENCLSETMWVDLLTAFLVNSCDLYSERMDSDGGQWLEFLDPVTGLPYYYHTGLLLSQWDRPPADSALPQGGLRVLKRGVVTALRVANASSYYLSSLELEKSPKNPTAALLEFPELFCAHPLCISLLFMLNCNLHSLDADAVALGTTSLNWYCGSPSHVREAGTEEQKATDTELSEEWHCIGDLCSRLSDEVRRKALQLLVEPGQVPFDRSGATFALLCSFLMSPSEAAVEALMWDLKVDAESALPYYLHRVSAESVWRCPCVWLELWCDDYDCAYYHNTLSGQTQWVRPAELGSSEEVKDAFGPVDEREEDVENDSEEDTAVVVEGEEEVVSPSAASLMKRWKTVASSPQKTVLDVREQPESESVLESVMDTREEEKISFTVRPMDLESKHGKRKKKHGKHKKKHKKHGKHRLRDKASSSDFRLLGELPSLGPPTSPPPMAITPTEQRRARRRRSSVEFAMMTASLKAVQSQRKEWLEQESKASTAPTSSSGQSNVVKRSVPREFLCAYSKTVMRDPVRSSTGQVFEREVIEKWLIGNGNICPVTHEPMEREGLLEDKGLRLKITLWHLAKAVEQNASAAEEEEADDLYNGF